MWWSAAPQVLLLDELTTFLDFEDQENVLQCVRHIVDTSRPLAAAAGGGGAGSAAAAQQQQQQAEAGVTALWVTHRLEELEYADSVRWVVLTLFVFVGGHVFCVAVLRVTHQLDPMLAASCGWLAGSVKLQAVVGHFPR